MGIMFMAMLLSIFIGTLFVLQVIFFEISRSRAVKRNDLSWFLTLEKPFAYNRTSYMVILCIICYLFGGVGTMFSAEWFLYLAIFVGCGVVADAVVQYLILQYGRIRSKKQIAEAKGLNSDLSSIEEHYDEDHNYAASMPTYNEMVIAKQYVTSDDHLAFMSVDQGEFAKAYEDYPALTYDVEPYGDIEVVKQKLADLPIRATQLTKDNKMPFKDDRINVLINEYSNYDKYEIQRVIKPGGYFIVNQFGSENYKEVMQMFMPIGFKNAWNKDTCADTLKLIGFEIVSQFEDIGHVRFSNINQMRTYFSTRIPDLATNLELYKALYIRALESIKEKGYYEVTTHRFLVVARNTHQIER